MTRLLATGAIVFSLCSSAFANERVEFRDGSARIEATVPANGSHTLTLSGKSFRNATFTQTSGENLPVRIKAGNEFLSSGHTTGFQVRSDRTATYQVIISNETARPAPIVLTIAKTGGGSDI